MTPPAEILYFAYGSNLDPAQMRQRCPSARFFAIARLDDHRLAFSRKSITRGCGVADVIPSVGDVVWGVVFQIAQGDLTELDRNEGFLTGRDGNAYERVGKVVSSAGDNGQRLEVQTYIANPQSDPPPPSNEYLNLIRGAASFWRLPLDYINSLQSHTGGHRQ